MTAGLATGTVRPASLFQRYLRHVGSGITTSPWFTLNAVLRVRGPLDVALLRDALDELVRRHELLRTRVTEHGGVPVQVVAPQVTAPLRREDARDIADPAWDHAPISAEAPCPVLVRLAGTDPRTHVLSLHVHHMVSDPLTLWGVLTELAALYTAATGHGPVPPPPSAQYGEYAAVERDQARAGRAASWRWWTGAVGGREFATVPRSPVGEPFAFRDELVAAAGLREIHALARRHRTTLLSTLFALLACAVGPRTTGGDLLFQTVFSKRDRPEWQRMLGPCLLTAYVPLPRPPERLTAGYAAQVRDVLLGAQRHCRVEMPAVAALTPFLDDPANIPTFFEYMPDRWPSGVRFGPATAEVVRAPGPKDTGAVAGLAVRSRTGTDGALSAHISGGGPGWTAELARRICAGVADLPADR